MKLNIAIFVSVVVGFLLGWALGGGIPNPALILSMILAVAGALLVAGRRRR